MGLRSLFTKRYKYEETNVNASYNPIEAIYYNDAVSIVEQCCRCCTNSTPAEKYEDKCTYIEKRVNDKHDSILEHSNIVLVVPKSRYEDLPDMLPGLRYINVVKDQNGIFLAGSVRAFKYFITHTNRDNITVQDILTCLENSIPRCLVKDITSSSFGLSEFDFPEYIGRCNVGLEFTDDTTNNYESYMNPVVTNSELIEIVNLDDISKATIDYEKVSHAETEDQLLPEISNAGPFDLLKLGTITVLFKGMSRAATHQLVRHRNGITQESQRYVDVSKNRLYTPQKEKYNGKRYTVKINNQNITTDLAGLNSILSGIYPQLVKQGVDKEDARGYLPTNSTCNKIYITFTWENLMSFFKLRRDKAAQLEIRQYADALYDTVKDVFDVIFSAYGVDMDYLIDNINTWYLEPALFNDYDTNDIDEILGDNEYEAEEGNTTEDTE